jgi:hypothetical protein
VFLHRLSQSLHPSNAPKPGAEYIFSSEVPKTPLLKGLTSKGPWNISTDRGSLFGTSGHQQNFHCRVHDASLFRKADSVELTRNDDVAKQNIKNSDRNQCERIVRRMSDGIFGINDNLIRVKSESPEALDTFM